MGVFADEIIQAMRGPFNIGMFLEMASSPSLHLWWGVADISVYSALAEQQKIVLDEDGRAMLLENSFRLLVESGSTQVAVGKTVYIGAGLLIEVPDMLEVLMNGTSDQVDFVMSGVDPSLLSKLDEEAPEIMGSRVTFSFCPLDERWQATGPLQPIWRGMAEIWGFSIKMPSKPGQNGQATVKLKCVSGARSRAASSLLTYTDNAQRQISETDAFCNQVAGMYQGRKVVWPV